METIVIFGGVAVILFVASLISKRRFGVLGLALAAGSVLSTIWVGTAGLLVSLTAVVPKGAWTDAVTLALVTLAPAVILLFHGSAYKSMAARLFGSLLFAGLAVTFLIAPLVPALPHTGLDKQVTDWLQANYSILVSMGLILAVFDLFITKTPKKSDDDKKKGKR